MAQVVRILNIPIINHVLNFVWL